MKDLNKWWKDLWFPAINLWNAPHRVETIMPLTHEEIKARLKMLDEISLLEILEISSEDIVEKFSEKIERIFGKSGIGVIRKIFGVILMAIAVKLFASNIQGLF